MQWGDAILTRVSAFIFVAARLQSSRSLLHEEGFLVGERARRLPGTYIIAAAFAGSRTASSRLQHPVMTGGGEGTRLVDVSIACSVGTVRK